MIFPAHDRRLHCTYKEVKDRRNYHSQSPFTTPKRIPSPSHRNQSSPRNITQTLWHHPWNDEPNKRDKIREQNRRDNPRDTLRYNPRQNGRGKQPPRRSDQSNKAFKTECWIHKNHEWTDCRMNPANSGGNRQNNDRWRSRRQEHRHHRRR